MKNYLATCQKVAYKSYFPYVLLFFVTLLIMLLDPLTPFANSNFSVDSNVYIYCAKQILNGNIMYQEVFDHKGPVTYLVDILGLYIGKGNTNGIWVINLFLLFISIVFTYKSLLIYFDRFVSIISAFSCLILYFLFSFGEGTNITEMFAIPYITISIYLFLKLFTDYKYKLWHFAIIGLLCSLTMLIKPNFIAIWFVGYLFVLLILLKNSEFKRIGLIIISSIISVIFVFTPFFIYFNFTNSLADFGFSFWDFNRAYSNFAIADLINRTWEKLWFKIIEHRGYVELFFFGSSIWTIINFRQIKQKVVVGFVLISILVTSVMISISPYDLKHYYILFVPLMAFPFALGYNTFKNNRLFILFIFVFINYYTLKTETKNRMIYLYYTQKTVQEDLISFIKKNTTVTDKIAVVGNDCWIYNYSNRQSATKYPYTHPIVSTNKYGKIIENNYYQKLKNNPPKLLIKSLYWTENKELSKINSLIENDYHRETVIGENYKCFIRK